MSLIRKSIYIFIFLLLLLFISLGGGATEQMFLVIYTVGSLLAVLQVYLVLKEKKED